MTQRVRITQEPAMIQSALHAYTCDPTRLGIRLLFDILGFSCELCDMEVVVNRGFKAVGISVPWLKKKEP